MLWLTVKLLHGHGGGTELVRGNHGPHAELQVLQGLGSLGQGVLQEPQRVTGVAVREADPRQGTQGLGGFGEALPHLGVRVTHLLRRSGPGRQQRLAHGVRRSLGQRLVELERHGAFVQGDEHVLRELADSEILGEGLGQLPGEPERLARLGLHQDASGLPARLEL